ncbi:protein of unknown function [Cyanobium sp. NIES-981]|nr:protein of unknown function [Cyanobium sp. NIES-981]
MLKDEPKTNPHPNDHYCDNKYPSSSCCTCGCGRLSHSWNCVCHLTY